MRETRDVVILVTMMMFITLLPVAFAVMYRCSAIERRLDAIEKYIETEQKKSLP